MTDAEALKMALDLMDHARLLSAYPDSKLKAARGRLEKMHRLYKMVDEVRAEHEAKRKEQYNCAKCHDTGMIPDPDRGSGWGPYYDTKCDCEAAK